MGFKGLTSRQLKKIDNQRIVELKEIIRILKSKSVIVDTSALKNRLEEHKEFVQRPHLTGFGGHKNLTRKQMKIEENYKGLINFEFIEGGDTYDTRKKLFLKNVKAIEDIKSTSIFDEEEKPAKIIRWPLNIVRIGGPIYLAHYFWTHVPEIENFIGLPERYNENFWIRASGIIIGTATFIIGRKIYKKIKKEQAFRTAMRSHTGRQDNLMFTTVSYLTRTKRKKAFYLIAKVEELIAKVETQTEVNRTKQEKKTKKIAEKMIRKIEKKKIREERKKEREIKRLKKEIKGDRKLKNVEEEAIKLTKKLLHLLYEDLKVLTEVSYRISKTLFYLIGGFGTLIVLGTGKTIKGIVKTIDDSVDLTKNEKYTKVEGWLINSKNYLFKRAVEEVEKLFNQ